jgi:hypothetical protein
MTAVTEYKRSIADNFKNLIDSVVDKTLSQVDKRIPKLGTKVVSIMGTVFDIFKMVLTNQAIDYSSQPLGSGEKWHTNWTVIVLGNHVFDDDVLMIHRQQVGHNLSEVHTSVKVLTRVPVIFF